MESRRRALCIGDPVNAIDRLKIGFAQGDFTKLHSGDAPLNIGSRFLFGRGVTHLNDSGEVGNFAVMVFSICKVNGAPQ